jgi:hypothetical protein
MDNVLGLDLGKAASAKEEKSEDPELVKKIEELIIQSRIFNHPYKPVFGFFRVWKDHHFLVQFEERLLTEILGGFFTSGYTVSYPKKYREDCVV